jgi:hypothetical protein
VRRRAALLALALAAAACGGGGGGGGPTQPPPPQPGITFTPAGATTQNSVALATGAGGSSTVLVLDLHANQVQNLYGVSFDLRYPSTVLRFDRALQGTALSMGGAVSTSLQVAESPAGNLVVGLTRLGAVPGMSGSGSLLTLEFAARTAGTGDLTFVAPSAVDPDGKAVAGVTWAAGSVQVRQ